MTTHVRMLVERAADAERHTSMRSFEEVRYWLDQWRAIARELLAAIEADERERPEAVTEEMVDAGCAAGSRAADEDGKWPNGYSAEEQTHLRKAVRGIITAALEAKGKV